MNYIENSNDNIVLTTSTIPAYVISNTCINSIYTKNINVNNNFYINYIKDYCKIKNLEILVPNKVIKVTFDDNSFEKSVCYDENVFDLEVGISICVLKKIFGSSEYHKIIKNAIKEYENNCKKIKEDKLKAELIKIKKEKKHIKKLARKTKKEKEAREARIKEQAEAILLAEKIKKEKENK